MQGFSFVAVISTVTLVNAAFWDANQNRIIDSNPLANKFDQINWPLLNDTRDPRFRGVFTYYTPNSGTCMGVLWKFWTGAPTAQVNASNPFALSTGVCSSDQMNQATSASPFVGVRLNTAQPTAPVNFWRFADKPGNRPFPSFNETIRIIPFTAVRNVDLSVFMLTGTIGDFLNRGYQFYEVANVSTSLKNANLSTVTTSTADPNTPGFFRYNSGGQFLSEGQVATQPGFRQTYQAVRVRYLNWQLTGSPVFVEPTNSTELPKLVGWGYAFRGTENLFARADVVPPCMLIVTQGIVFNFAQNGCLLDFKYRYFIDYNVRLPNTATYNLNLANYVPPFKIDSPSTKWPVLPVTFDLNINWRANFSGNTTFYSG